MVSTLIERTFAYSTCSSSVLTTSRASSASICQFSGPPASFRQKQSQRRSLPIRRSRRLSSASSFTGPLALKCKPSLRSSSVGLRGQRTPSVGGVGRYSSHESAATEQHLNGAGVKNEATLDKNSLPETASSEGQLRPDFSFLNSDVPPHLAVKDLETAAEIDAWELLRSSIVTFCGTPVGTIAAQDPTSVEAQNYDQVFIRDFIPSAIAFLLKGEYAIVREFLLNTLRLQSWEKTVDCYNPGQGLMPASFKVKSIPVYGTNEMEEILDPDFGEAAIGRVAPVDSGLWWIILLRAYGKHTGDYELQGRIEAQTGMDMILQLCLADGFDMFPTLLVTDGSCMIDRRMGIHGHPLEIQALFFSALRCAQEMINEETYPVLCRSINSRLSALVFHVREYYWLDMKKLNEIYRYQTEEYSHDAVNKFNIYPDQIPPWLLDWMPDKGGYLIGNLQPAHMDFRFFTLGNLWSIVSSLSDDHQSAGILELIDVKWKDFMGRMPIKITFPALEREEWRIITGADPKNTPWSYHNAGSWPVLLWQFTVACIKMGKLDMAQRAVEAAEQRLVRDRWPEYYDTRSGRLIGKQARLQQTWTIAGFLVSKMLIRDPAAVSILTSENDFDFLAAGACGIFLPRRVRGKPKV